MTNQNQESVQSPGAPVVSVDEAVHSLFHIAALLLGNEQEAAQAVEEVVALPDLAPDVDEEQARTIVRDRLIVLCLNRLEQAAPGSLNPAAIGAAPQSCIENEDLYAAGMTPEQLQALLTDPAEDRLRQWLERLPPVLRAVFVMRAIVGRDNKGAAANLRNTIAAAAAGWTPGHVSQVYRQALCSLASSLVSSTH